MLSWVPHTAVLERAHVEGFDEALLLNERGQLAECTSANIFFVRGGKVLTPPLASGCLPGITREILLEIAPVSGIEIREQELDTKDISSGDEVFISSTTGEVAAVESIVPGGTFPAPGPMTRKLQRIFGDYVQSYLDHVSAR
jgi:branched-chain amino acid aminotransferase